LALSKQVKLIANALTGRSDADANFAQFSFFVLNWSLFQFAVKNFTRLEGERCRAQDMTNPASSFGFQLENDLTGNCQ
jgi:hypothetical protein